MVPTALLYTDVSALAIRAWAILDDTARRDPTVTLTQAAIGRVLHRSTRTVRDLLDELEAAGFLTRQHAPGAPTTYRPTRRPRPVRDPGNLLPHPAASPRQNPAGVSPGALDLCAREETQTRRPRWCGDCHPDTRLLDTVDDGPVRRCPACHPMLAAPWDVTR